jgi:acyl-CoA reductase-like NAD-dependent aldehyde dehydrogenase
MEGVNAYGIWEFSGWPELARQIKKGFEFGKQRCTAYARYVIQRKLFPRFLEMYLPVLGSIRVGHPLLTNGESDEPPALDFGPLINAKACEGLRVMYSEAIGRGAISLYESELDESLFFPEQDISAYIAPRALINVPRNTALYHVEPFGPIDTMVVVDTVEELVAEMNVSNGSLVASIACDDPALSRRVASQLRSFKVGIGTVRSRGDREEPFGGIGESWKGCFVGGQYLVQAVTQGPAGERLYGNFDDYSLLPEHRGP